MKRHLKIYPGYPQRKWQDSWGRNRSIFKVNVHKSEPEIWSEFHYWQCWCFVLFFHVCGVMNCIAFNLTMRYKPQGCPSWVVVLMSYGHLLEFPLKLILSGDQMLKIEPIAVYSFSFQRISIIFLFMTLILGRQSCAFYFNTCNVMLPNQTSFLMGWDYNGIAK